MACFPFLNGHSEFFGFLEYSLKCAKVLGFGFSQLWNLEFGCSKLFRSRMKALYSNQSFNTIKFAASSRWSFRCRSHCYLSWLKIDLVAEQRIPSHSRLCSNPSRVKTLTVFLTTFAKRTMPLKFSCLTGGWLYTSLIWDLTLTLSLPKFVQRRSQAGCCASKLKPSPKNAAFAWPVRLILRYCNFSLSFSRFWCEMTSKNSATLGKATGLLISPITWILVIPSDHDLVGKLQVVV